MNHRDHHLIGVRIIFFKSSMRRILLFNWWLQWSENFLKCYPVYRSSQIEVRPLDKQFFDDVIRGHVIHKIRFLKKIVINCCNEILYRCYYIALKQLSMIVIGPDLFFKCPQFFLESIFFTSVFMNLYYEFVIYIDITMWISKSYSVFKP